MSCLSRPGVCLLVLIAIIALGQPAERALSAVYEIDHSGPPSWTLAETRPEVKQRKAFTNAMAAYIKGNYRKAFKSMENLARAGHLVAQHNMYVMLFHGVGRERDTPMSAFWLAAHDESVRRLKLATCSFFGSIEWPAERRRQQIERCGRLAETGDVMAPKILRSFFADRTYPEFDLGQSFYWASVAARNGWLDDASVVRGVFAGERISPYDKMGAAELAAAKKRVRLEDVPLSPFEASQRTKR